MRYLTAFIVSTLAITALGQNPSEQEAVFLNPASFAINVIPNGTDWKEIGNPPGRESKSMNYKVSLKNNTTTPLDRLRVEYCIYRDRMLNGFPFVDTDTFSQKLQTIAPAATETVATKVSPDFKSPADGFLNEAAGICFRIYLLLPDGREIMREIRFPESLLSEQYPWKNLKTEHDAKQNTPEGKSAFLNPDSFIVEVLTRDTDWKEIGNPPGRESKSLHYEIKLKNNGPAPLTDVRMDYCIYRNRKNNGTTTIDTYAFGKEVGTVEPISTEIIRTGPQISFRTPSGFLNEVAGIRIKIYLPMSDGLDAMREFCIPESLSDKKYPWKEPEAKK